MKFRYKVLIVVFFFVAALVYFASDISGSFFGNTSQVLKMSASTLPTIYLQSGENVCNRLHGYASNLDHMLMRETITPIASDREFTVFIEENESDVKKLKYEVYNTEGREIESGSFTVLDAESGPKKVRIQLQETLKTGQEYIVKLTLITNLSKRVYFYTRIKMYDNGHMAEKLEYTRNFHEILLHGTRTEKESLKKYLESSRRTDNTSFANVSIKSSFDLVTWGDLEPEVIWEEVPIIHEFYDQLATIELVSLIKADAGSGGELYLVRENFRILYTEDRTYLYNYDRTMETLFDVERTSLHRDEFKLGVTKAENVMTGASQSLKYLAFTYNGGLYVYDVDSNILNCAFSFRDDLTGDYSRQLYDQHDVRLIKVHENGDTDFMVYGYMNRGEYEGRVGIVLYRYINRDHRIEEQLYIPVNTSYQLLKADFSDFTYLSEKDVLYFSLYNCIYSYDLTTRKLETLAANVTGDNLVFCEEDRYLAWQEGKDETAIGKLSVMKLSDGSIRQITAGNDEVIRLLGKIDNNIIYAYSRRSDIWTKPDGSRLAPSYRLCIEDADGKIIKRYQEDGFYIDSLDVDENKVTLHRMTRKAGDNLAYNAAEDDTIMNRLVEKTPPVHISKRVTDKILTEYYISLPGDIKIDTIPLLKRASGSVIRFDTTARLADPENFDRLFYAYCYGDVVNTSDIASETIAAADLKVGTVINRDGKVVWERGIKAARASVSSFTPIKAEGGTDSVQAAMKMLLTYKNVDADVSDYDISKGTVRDRLQKDLWTTVVDLKGASLDEVLYYVYKQRPVIAFKADGNAVVITAYDAVSVTYYEPASDRTTKQPLKEAVATFEAGGNLFLSYIE